MANNTRPRSVCLKCYDSTELIVDESVAKQSQFVKKTIERHNLDSIVIKIEVPFVVTGKILEKVLDYCTKHAAASASTATTTATTSANTNTAAGEASGGGATGELRRWDEEFVRSLKSEPNTLLDVLVAACELDVQGLIDLLCEGLPPWINLQDVLKSR